MEGTAAADDEYMTMDAEQWSELDDTYENGDKFGLDLKGNEGSSRRETGPDSRGQRQNEMKKETAATNRQLQNTQNLTTARPPISLTDRYITIRRPPTNAKKEQRTSELDFLRLTIVCLLLLCILLLGGLLGLSFYSVATTPDILTSEIDNVSEITQNLTKELDNLRNISRSLHISSTDNFLCFSGSHLSLHCEVEEQMGGELFHLSNTTVNNGVHIIPLPLNCTLSRQ